MAGLLLGLAASSFGFLSFVTPFEPGTGNEWTVVLTSTTAGVGALLAATPFLRNRPGIILGTLVGLLFGVVLRDFVQHSQPAMPPLGTRFTYHRDEGSISIAVLVISTLIGLVVGMLPDLRQRSAIWIGVLMGMLGGAVVARSILFESYVSAGTLFLILVGAVSGGLFGKSRLWEMWMWIPYGLLVGLFTGYFVLYQPAQSTVRDPDGPIELILASGLAGMMIGGLHATRQSLNRSRSVPPEVST